MIVHTTAGALSILYPESLMAALCWCRIELTSSLYVQYVHKQVVKYLSGNSTTPPSHPVYVFISLPVSAGRISLYFEHI